MNQRPVRAATISVVLPVFNEENAVAPLATRIAREISSGGDKPQIVFVNDGSNDGTGRVLDQLAARDPAIRVLHLSRNFGQQSAILAGLSVATGDAVLVMDADFQDDPAALATFIRTWREGADIVYAIRVARKENPFKRFLFAGFYRMLNQIAQTPMPLDAGAFSLMDQRVARRVADLLRADGYFPGARGWVGFQQVGVPVERSRRYDERPRVSLLGLFRLAKTAIFSYSTTPLTIFYLIAFAAVAVFVGLWSFVLYHRLFTGLAIPGWTSQMMTACFFGAVNALGIAIIGEYVARIYEQVRRRPTYLIDRAINVEPAETRDSTTDE